MLLRIDSSAEDGNATIIAAGEIDLATVSLLSTAIADTVHAGTTALTVNLNNVTYIDSAGLGVLVGAFKRLKALGGTFTVRCTQPRVLRLLTLTGLHRVLTIEGGPDGGEPSDDKLMESASS